MGADDTSVATVSRAKSYFLVSAIVGNSLTFAIGPKLLDDEETPDKHHEDQKRKAEEARINGREESDEESANTVSCSDRSQGQEEHFDETTTLLPDRLAQRGGEILGEVSYASERQWIKLPLVFREALAFAWSFLNAPLIGATLGAIIGLTPPLHKAFFNDPSEGGFLKSSLTTSVKNVGELFATLQLVVVGAKLSNSLLNMKQGKASGEVKFIPMLSIFFVRFILWPM